MGAAVMEAESKLAIQFFLGFLTLTPLLSSELPLLPVHCPAAGSSVQATGSLGVALTVMLAPNLQSQAQLHGKHVWLGNMQYYNPSADLTATPDCPTLMETQDL